ncbi:MAG: GIY-YIG nuclease family protein [Candidatus Nanoarchaeia archaeon]|nr:GIY-YIG nuclease family protein [Candidatus Nanoarchaeia archaeon]
MIKNIKKSSQKEDLYLQPPTTEKLGYYVYILEDDKGKPFYIGKGVGNRINQHFTKLMDTEARKSEKVKTIEKLGSKVKKIVLRHGITSEEAFILENAMIDFIGIENLTNIVKGHSNGKGIADLEELKIKYEPEDAVFKDSALLININKLYRRGMSQGDIYEAVRKYWRIDLDRARSIKLVCAVSQGIIRGVFYQDKWLVSGRGDLRCYFVGRIADKADVDRYLNKSVNKYWKKGAQYPVKYIEI